MFKEMFEKQISTKLTLDYDIYVSTNANYNFKYDDISCIDWYVDNAKIYRNCTFYTGRVYGFISDNGIRVVGFNVMKNDTVVSRITL